VSEPADHEAELDRADWIEHLAADAIKHLGRYRDLAAILRVTPNQVYMWHQRAERNGFPQPVACYIGGGVGSRGRGSKGGPMFVINDVMVWWLSYTPAKGAPPLGNRNAPKHRVAGRFASAAAIVKGGTLGTSG
jgi:hypothetical protein